MDIGYAVKYKNSQNNTAKQHIKVLVDNGKVIWGQWRTGESTLCDKTYMEMNKSPFYLYAVDSKVAVLKMHCIHVYTREEVIAEHLEYLIPCYYNIDTPCSAYYLIDNIEILPSDFAANLRNRNTKNPFTKVGNLDGSKPHRIEEINPSTVVLNLMEQEVAQEKEKAQLEEDCANLKLNSTSVTDITDYSNTYVIYKYHSKTANKDYIGLTNNFTRRRKEHENSKNWIGSKKFLYVLMSIFGLSDFTVEILHSGLSATEAKYWEAKEIEVHNAYYPNGLNERNESHHLIDNKPKYID